MALAVAGCLSSCATKPTLTTRERFTLLSAQLKAKMASQAAHMEVMTGRAPAKDREIANATLALIKRVGARMSTYIDEAGAKLKSDPDTDVMVMSANTQEAFLSASRTAAEKSWVRARAASASYARMMAENERDLSQFERDFSHKGAKALADSFRKGIKEGDADHGMGAMLTRTARLSEAIKHGCDYLDAHRSDWSVVNGKVKFANPSAQRGFRQAVGSR